MLIVSIIALTGVHICMPGSGRRGLTENISFVPEVTCVRSVSLVTVVLVLSEAISSKRGEDRQLHKERFTMAPMETYLFQMLSR